MRIYISCASEDLPLARQLAELVARHPSVAGGGDTTIYNPLDDPDLSVPQLVQRKGLGFSFF